MGLKLTSGFGLENTTVTKSDFLRPEEGKGNFQFPGSRTEQRGSAEEAGAEHPEGNPEASFPVTAGGPGLRASSLLFAGFLVSGFRDLKSFHFLLEGGHVNSALELPRPHVPR